MTLKLDSPTLLALALTINSIIHHFIFPIEYQPDRFEKELGIGVVRNPDLSTKLDFYPQMLSNEVNVYLFYSKLLEFLESLGISLTLIQFCISTLILFLIFKISQSIFFSILPGMCYAIVMLGFSGLLVYPDFLYTDQGFAPRQIALLSTILAIRVYLRKGRPVQIGVVLGLGTLIHPSIGFISFLLISLGIMLFSLFSKGTSIYKIKDQLVMLLSFLTAGGWFALMVAFEQFIDQVNLSSEDLKLSTWVFSVLRLPYALFDWRQALLLALTLALAVVSIKSSISRLNEEKILMICLMLSSLFLYLTFVIGITFQIPTLISLYGIRVYNVWILGVILFLADFSHSYLRNRTKMLTHIDRWWNIERLQIVSKSYRVLLWVTLLIINVGLVSAISQTQQLIKNDSQKLPMLKNLEDYFGSKLLADQILAPTSMQIAGSIHHWKTIPRTSSDVLQWLERLDHITSNSATEIYGISKTPILVWDHNQYEYSAKLDLKTIEIGRDGIRSLCKKYPIRVFITPVGYNNKMSLNIIYSDVFYEAYEIKCDEFQVS